MPLLHHPFILKSLRVMRDSIGGPVRKHAHQKHHAPIDSYVRFIERLIEHLIEQEKRMTQISQAIDKVENQRDQWKAYAQMQKTKAEASDRARQAAEDKLAALPFLPDAEDAANVNGVIAAPDDLPPDDTSGTGSNVPTDTLAGGVS